MNHQILDTTVVHQKAHQACLAPLFNVFMTLKRAPKYDSVACSRTLGIDLSMKCLSYLGWSCWTENEDEVTFSSADCSFNCSLKRNGNVFGNLHDWSDWRQTWSCFATKLQFNGACYHSFVELGILSESKKILTLCLPCCEVCSVTTWHLKSAFVSVLIELNFANKTNKAYYCSIWMPWIWSYLWLWLALATRDISHWQLLQR